MPSRLHQLLQVFSSIGTSTAEHITTISAMRSTGKLSEESTIRTGLIDVGERMTRSRKNRWISSMFTDRKLMMDANARSHHVLTLVLDGALYLAPLAKDINVCYCW